MSHRISWRPDDSEHALFDELMAGSMPLHDDATTIAIKQVRLETAAPRHVLVIDITRSSSDDGLRDSGVLCSLLEKAKRDGWRCIAVCEDTAYLRKLSCIEYIDAIVCRTARPLTKAASKPIFKIANADADLPRILEQVCSV